MNTSRCNQKNGVPLAAKAATATHADINRHWQGGYIGLVVAERMDD